MSDYATTSVPAWAVPGACFQERTQPVAGRSRLVVRVGAAARADDPVTTTVVGPTAAAVRDGLADSIATARVGVRVQVHGSAAACLAVRGQLVGLGLEEDEIEIRADDTAHVAVWCAHCRAVTTAFAAIGEEVHCDGCDRDLHVYHHVSRLTGQYLGFDAAAESVEASG